MSKKPGLQIEGPGALYKPSGKRLTRDDWPRNTLPGLIVWQREEEEYEALWRKEEQLDLTWDLDGIALEKYVAEVREHNIRVEEERQRMIAEKDRLQREERRQKMRDAKIAAQTAAASGAGPDASCSASVAAWATHRRGTSSSFANITRVER